MVIHPGLFRIARREQRRALLYKCTVDYIELTEVDTLGLENPAKAEALAKRFNDSRFTSGDYDKKTDAVQETKERLLLEKIKLINRNIMMDHKNFPAYFRALVRSSTE